MTGAFKEGNFIDRMRQFSKRTSASTCIFTLLLAFLVQQCLYAQFVQPRFTRIDKSKGISSNAPTQIRTDKNLHYWLTSYNGLIEFDGSKFRTYHMPSFLGDQPGSEMLYDLEFENDSTLIITHVYGVARFNIYSHEFSAVPLQIKQLNKKTPLVYRTIFKDEQNNLFFCCMETGVQKLDKEKGSIHEFEPLKKEIPDYFFKITSLKRGLWLLHSREGLYLYDAARKKLMDTLNYPAAYRWIRSERVKGFVNDYAEIDALRFVSVFKPETNVYDVICYDTRNGSFRALPIISKKGRMFKKDSFKRLWLLGFRDAVEVYDPVSDSVYAVPDKTVNTADIDFSVCYSIFEDHEHNLWFCTNNGLLTYNLYQNSYEVLSQKLPSAVFRKPLQVNDNEIWFLTDDKGVFSLNTKTNIFHEVKYASAGEPYQKEILQAIRRRNVPEVWLAHPSGIISRINLKDGSSKLYRNPLFKEEDVDFCETESGRLFLLTLTGKITLYHEDTDKFELLANLNSTDSTGPPIEVNTCLALSEEELLIGTADRGMMRYHLKTGKQSLLEPGEGRKNVPESPLIVLLKKIGPYVYGGMLNGMFRYDPLTGHLENFNYRDNLSLGCAFHFTADADSNIIAVTTTGIYQLDWNKKYITDLSRKTDLDRLQLSGVLYHPQTGKIYITTENGIYRISQNRAKVQPVFRPVIQSILSNGQLIYLRDTAEVVLDRKSRSLQLNFNLSSYKYKDDIEFFYRMDDGDWLPAEGREIAFSNLSGGEHFFELKAVYKGDRQLSSTASLKLHIVKTVFEQWWFYAIIFVFLLVGLYGLYRIRVNRLLAIEKVRLQLARDLHDDMGSTLSTINILSAIASEKMEEQPSAAKTYLQKISANSQDMMESMDDIVWNINPVNDSMEKVIHRMREFASGILEPKQIQLVFETEPEVSDLRLSMALRRDFYLIYKEAVNNAAKYSGCSKLRIRLCTLNEDLVLKIQDDGKGFEMNKRDEGNGISNMYKRANHMHAVIQIWSSPGNGTRIELTKKISEL